MKKILRQRELGKRVAKIFGLCLHVFSLLERLGERTLGIINLFGITIIVVKRR